MIQRWFWLAYLVLITLAAALGADMAVSYLAGQLSQSTTSEERPSDQTPRHTQRRPASDYAVIVQRNIFNANPNPPIQNPEKKTPIVIKEPKEEVKETPLQLKLTGMATSDDGRNYAFIEDMTARGQQQLYQVGDAIQNRIIVEIRDDCVFLERNGNSEKLCFPNHQDSSNATPRQQRISKATSDAVELPNNASDANVIQVDDATWQIRREVMQEQIANLGGLSQQARVTPYVVQGETRGFRVTRLKANGLLQKMGLQHGDVLQQVNGSSFTSSADALQQAYHHIQQGGTVRLGILRGNRAETLTYEIR